MLRSVFIIVTIDKCFYNYIRIFNNVNSIAIQHFNTATEINALSTENNRLLPDKVLFVCICERIFILLLYHFISTALALQQ